MVSIDSLSRATQEQSLLIEIQRSKDIDPETSSRKTKSNFRA